ncbi:hypothetical protein [Ascidiaceihabitans sp.]|uniref:hypothetical protein n=1 Tax=Ascidiaceihabitans sp. TaxID=1872644 RepID=UPI00329884A4
MEGESAHFFFIIIGADCNEKSASIHPETVFLNDRFGKIYWTAKRATLQLQENAAPAVAAPAKVGFVRPV